LRKFILFIYGSLCCCIQPKSQTIHQIVTKHLDAIGGVANIEKIRSITMNGRVNVEGNALDLHILLIQGKLCRREFKYMDVNNYDVIIEGMEGWTYMPFLANALPVQKTLEEKMAVQDDLNIADRFFNYQQKRNKLTLIGKEKINGNLCFKIEITDSLGHQSVYYIDTKTYLINMVSENNRRNGQDYWEDVSVSDYKPVNGVLFPFLFQSSKGKTLFKEITVQQPPFLSDTWITIDRGQYSIQFPDDMVPDTSQEFGTDFILHTYQDNLLDSFAENITILIDTTAVDTDVDVLGYTRRSLLPLKNLYKGFEVQIDSVIQSANGPHHKWVYSGVADNKRFLKIEQHTFLKKGKAYIITLTAEADKFTLYKEKCEKVMNSFKFK
jgi:hypothetical protein